MSDKLNIEEELIELYQKALDEGDNNVALQTLKLLKQIEEPESIGQEFVITFRGQTLNQLIDKQNGQKEEE